jgi:hypothetical protein
VIVIAGYNPKSRTQDSRIRRDVIFPAMAVPGRARPPNNPPFDQGAARSGAAVEAASGVGAPRLCGSYQGLRGGLLGPAEQPVRLTGGIALAGLDRGDQVLVEQGSRGLANDDPGQVGERAQRVKVPQVARQTKRTGPRAGQGGGVQPFGRIDALGVALLRLVERLQVAAAELGQDAADRGQVGLVGIAWATWSKASARFSSQPRKQDEVADQVPRT